MMSVDQIRPDSGWYLYEEDFASGFVGPFETRIAALEHKERIDNFIHEHTGGGSGPHLEPVSGFIAQRLSYRVDDENVMSADEHYAWTHKCITGQEV